MSLPFYIERAVGFDLATGIAGCEERPVLERHYSDMKNMYYDETARQQLEDEGDGIVYRFHDLGLPESEFELAYGTSILYPGTVGDEYHMTNGHFHHIAAAAEVYYCTAGYGMMMMENPEGDVLYREMRPGQAVYVPGRYAHRSINLSAAETLITFFVLRADAGHDYGIIRENGFRKLVVKNGEGYNIIDNPRRG